MVGPDANLCIIVTEVSSLGDVHTPRACKIADRQLGQAAEAPLIDPDFQSIFALPQLSRVDAGHFNQLNQTSFHSFLYRKRKTNINSGQIVFDQSHSGNIIASLIMLNSVV